MKRHMSRRAAMVSLLAPAVFLPAQSRSQPQDPLAGRFGGAFSLVDHNGKPVTNETFLGKFVLIYFGFTTCTDTCPIDLPLIMGAIDRLGDRAKVVVPLFITVDPRDKPEIMKDYVEAHYPGLTGLTGTEDQLAAAARAFRVHRRKLSLPPTSGSVHAHGHASAHAQHGANYTIDHGSLSYLLGPDGRFITLFPHSTSLDRIAEIIGKYLP